MSGKGSQRKKKSGTEKQDKPLDLIGQLLDDLSTHEQARLNATTSSNNVSGKENTSEERELVPFFGNSSDEKTKGGSGEPLAEVVGVSNEKRKKRNTKKKEKESQHTSVNSENDKAGKKKDKNKKKEKDSSSSSDQDGGRRPSLWAGSAFLNSPPPEDLPMPSAALLAKVSVDSQLKKRDNSTEELKKMLNLEGCAAASSESDKNDAVASDDIRRMLKIG